MSSKIVILTSENFPYGSPGANYLRNLSSGLQLNSNYLIEVWLQSGNSRPYIGFQNQRVNSINNVHYRFLGGYALRPRSTIGKFYNDVLGLFGPLMRIIKERRSINKIIVYNSSALSVVFSLLLCRLMNIQTIKIIPEWYEKSSVLTSWKKYFKWWDFIFGMKVLNFHFDKLIVLSSYLKNFYISQGYPTRQLYVLPNLVNLDEFSSLVGTNSVVNERNDRVVIGYSGAPVRKDGILDLLQAFGLLVKEHSNVELLVIGDISQTATAIPYLRAKADELGIMESQIRFTGLVDFMEVPGLLNSCDILVLARPSGQFAEAGFPTKLGEYLACKKPVVVTKVGDIPKYFEDKVNAILVEPDNSVSICKGINFLIENSDIAKVIGLRGFDWVNLNLEYKIATIPVVDFIEIK